MVAGIRGRLASLMALVLLLVAGPAYAQQTESRIRRQGARFEQGRAARRDGDGHVEGHRRERARRSPTATAAIPSRTCGPGAYVVKVELSGFQEQRREVVLGVGQVESVDAGTGRCRRLGSR